MTAAGVRREGKEQPIVVGYHRRAHYGCVVASDSAKSTSRLVHDLRRTSQCNIDIFFCQIPMNTYCSERTMFRAR